MLQGCLNGDRAKDFHPAVPCSPDELARDARAAVDAGAEEIHVHPRGSDGLESLEPEDIHAALNALRQSVPGISIGLSTRSPIRPGGRARHDPMRRWSVLPDYVSVNLVEEDAPEVMALMLGKGIGIEAGLWSVADAQRLVARPTAPRCLRVRIEINEQDAEEGRAVADGILQGLDHAGLQRPRLLHGSEATKWPLFRYAILRGLYTRIGLEDGAVLPSGEVADGNVALIGAARTLMRG